MSLKSTEIIVFRGVIYVGHLEAIGLFFHNGVIEDQIMSEVLEIIYHVLKLRLM